MKKICILGASGSIGTQTLDILARNRDEFVLTGFSVGDNTKVIPGIIKSFPSVKTICVKDPEKARMLARRYLYITFFSGDAGLLSVIDQSRADMVVNALVGFVGLKPTLYSLEHNLKVALANKEALVVGGELVNHLLKNGHGKIYPIDSEHSAIWKCLKEDDHDVHNLVITASGGAFRGKSREELVDVTPSEALAHPTWNMGDKITIDCATMVNKSFEIIEAYYLFGYKFEEIQILLHDESYIHSMVLYEDGWYRADINKPDMRVPIKFALFEGELKYETFLAEDFHDFGRYHFHDFVPERYPMVANAKIVIDKGGSFGACYNAANEVAVHAFLSGEIPFLAIETIITKCLESHQHIKNISYDILVQVDAKTRQFARNLIEKGEF